MLTNWEAEAHAHTIVFDLIRSAVEAAKPPLEVTKLEGDAVFLYALVEGTRERRDKICREALTGLDAMFRAYDAKLRELARGNLCPCGACMHIERLRLKAVVHSGSAVFDRIGRFDELSGPDVILVHRLLKNSIERDSYILLTDAAAIEAAACHPAVGETVTESYDGIGQVNGAIFMPPLLGETAEPSHDASNRIPSFASRASRLLSLSARSILMRLRIMRSPVYTNMP